MMTSLQKVLKNLKIQCNETELFTLRCQCSSAVWTRFVNSSISARDESLVRDDVVYADDPNNLEFSVMVYEARWAGGKIGFKIKDDENYANVTIQLYIKQISKNIYNSLLNEIGHIYHST